MEKHYSYGSGSTGCMYDSGPHTASTLEDAIEGALCIFDDLSDGALACARADLLAHGIHYFPELVRGYAGADYVEVVEQAGPCPESDD